MVSDGRSVRASVRANCSGELAALTAARTTVTELDGASLTLGTTLGAGWRVSDLDNLNASITFTNSSSGANLPGFTDLSGSLTYTRSFSIIE